MNSWKKLFKISALLISTKKKSLKVKFKLINSIRRSTAISVITNKLYTHLKSKQNPALDLSHDDDHGEISGEFGDNISMTSRGPDIVAPGILAPPLPPDEENVQTSCIDHLKILKPRHMKALIWKNFLWMWWVVAFNQIYLRFSNLILLIPSLSLVAFHNRRNFGWVLPTSRQR